MTGISSASAVGAAVAGRASGVGSAMRLIAAAQLCTGEARLPNSLHPTQLTVFGSPAAGAIVGNVALTVAFAILHLIALRAFTVVGARYFPKMVAEMDLHGVMRFPSAPLLVMQFVYQGIVGGAFILVLNLATPGGVVFGVATILASLALPYWLLRRVRYGVPGQAVFVVDAQIAGPRYRIVRGLIGPGEWVNRFRSTDWVNRYTSVVRPYTGRAAWFSFFDYSSSMAIAAVTSLETQNHVGCGHVKSASAAIFLLMVGTELVSRPHSRQRDLIIDVLNLSLQAAAMIIMAVGYYADLDDGQRDGPFGNATLANATDAFGVPLVPEEDGPGHWLFRIATTFLVASAIFMLVRGLCDVLGEVVVITTSRRIRLQKEFWGESSKREQDMFRKLLGSSRPDIDLSATADSVSLGGAATPTPCHDEVTPSEASEVSHLTPLGRGSRLLTNDFTPTSALFTPQRVAHERSQRSGMTRSASSGVLGSAANLGGGVTPEPLGSAGSAVAWQSRTKPGGGGTRKGEGLLKSPTARPSRASSAVSSFSSMSRPATGPGKSPLLR